MKTAIQSFKIRKDSEYTELTKKLTEKNEEMEQWKYKAESLAQ